MKYMEIEHKGTNQETMVIIDEEKGQASAIAVCNTPMVFLATLAQIPVQVDRFCLS